MKKILLAIVAAVALLFTPTKSPAAAGCSLAFRVDPSWWISNGAQSIVIEEKATGIRHLVIFGDTGWHWLSDGDIVHVTNSVFLCGVASRWVGETQFEHCLITDPENAVVWGSDWQWADYTAMVHCDCTNGGSFGGLYVTRAGHCPPQG